MSREDERKRSRWNRRFSYVRAAGWAAMIPVSFVFGWVYSVAFVSVLSMWALVESAWAAARADDPE